jgi:hypothetical protein
MIAGTSALSPLEIKKTPFAQLHSGLAHDQAISAFRVLVDS